MYLYKKPLTMLIKLNLQDLVEFKMQDAKYSSSIVHISKREFVNFIYGTHPSEGNNYCCYTREGICRHLDSLKKKSVCESSVMCTP